MRLLALLGVLLIVQLVLADSYYDADTCGKALSPRDKRTVRGVRTRRAVDEDEEEEEEEGSGQTTAPKKEEEKDEDEAAEETEFGQDDDSQTEKVMGGMDARVGELPWAVLIKITKEGGSSSFCGGTLISKRHVITAAHCFIKGSLKHNKCDRSMQMTEEEIVKEVRLSIGGNCAETKPGSCSQSQLGQLAHVKRVVFTTPFFQDNCSKSLWDVAILELVETITTPHACLPHLHNMDSFRLTHAEMHSFGYGNDPTKGIVFNTRLQKVNLGLPHEANKCKKYWRLPYDWLICTRETATRNVCQGDSGGGILSQHGGRFHLMGMISFGSSCDVGLKNAGLADAQVNMDVRLYTATIDKLLLRQTPNYRDLWKQKTANGTAVK